MTPAATGLMPPPPASGGPGTGQPVSPTARQTWRRLRLPLVIAAVILVGGALVVLLQPRASAGYLDPGDPGPFGARALTQILSQRGHPVVRAGTVARAAQAAAAARNVTVVVTSPQDLPAGQFATLARAPGDRVLVEPDPAALRSLAPGVQVNSQARVQPAVPGCGLGAARLAGDADTGGLLLRVTAPAAARCYPIHGAPSLVSYGYRGRTITVLGTGAPLSNGDLTSRGDAALALNVLEHRHTIVWLTPGGTAAGGGTGTSGATGQTPLADLVPWPVYLIVIQLAVATVVTAIWRMRRLGPLVTEPLPVVVRAAETVEGHGRLYRARRSRDRAAAALRQALLDRLVPALGLSRDAGHDTITAAIADRSGRDAADVAAALYGAVPQDDTALVRLADTLDSLEREVRQP